MQTERKLSLIHILIEAGAVEKLEEEMSEGILREYISPLVICDTNTYAATEELMEDIYDRCQVLVLDAEGLQADRHAMLRHQKNTIDRYKNDLNEMADAYRKENQEYKVERSEDDLFSGTER